MEEEESLVFIHLIKDDNWSFRRRDVFHTVPFLFCTPPLTDSSTVLPLLAGGGWPLNSGGFRAPNSLCVPI